jgi:hypothetical protein
MRLSRNHRESELTTVAAMPKGDRGDGQGACRADGFGVLFRAAVMLITVARDTRFALLRGGVLTGSRCAATNGMSPTAAFDAVTATDITSGIPN